MDMPKEVEIHFVYFIGLEKDKKNIWLLTLPILAYISLVIVELLIICSGKFGTDGQIQYYKIYYTSWT